MSSRCDECTKSLPTSGDYVKCLNCKSNYHFAPCTSIGKTTYDSMNTERRNNWKCHNCRKVKLPNPPTGIHEDNSQQPQQKQLRDVDECEDNREENVNAKRFKDSLSLNTLNSKLCFVQTDINDIKTSIQLMSANMNTTHIQIKEEIQIALTNITSTLTNLAEKVGDLYNKNIENEKQIIEMDKRINKLEQQAISKNIEISNVQNTVISADDVIKKIATSLKVDITHGGINTAYRLKSNQNKIIVEFSSMEKKRELVSKIRAHRIDAQVINKENSNDDRQSSSNNKTNYIFVNDQLTPYNRRLLWRTKTRAKECNWKFVWVKNGTIFARKTENSPLFSLKNTADVDVITP